MTTVGDFSGNNFDTQKPVDECNMKCEMILNETDSVFVERTSGGFQINSNLFTIKYGDTVYNFSNSQAIHYIFRNSATSGDGIIHNGLFNEDYGIISELVFKTVDRNNYKLYMYIPIYKSFQNNENGNILNKINNLDGEERLDIRGLFPKNVAFYTYSNPVLNERHVVFMNSNIMIKDFTNVENIIKINFRTKHKDIDIKEWKKFKNKHGIIEGLDETTIIDCQPIDDDGMLLIDREKGLSQTGISKTSSLVTIAETLMRNPAAQFVMGAVLLSILTYIMKSGELLLKSKKMTGLDK